MLVLAIMNNENPQTHYGQSEVTEKEFNPLLVFFNPLCITSNHLFLLWMVPLVLCLKVFVMAKDPSRMISYLML